MPMYSKPSWASLSLSNIFLPSAIKG